MKLKSRYIALCVAAGMVAAPALADIQRDIQRDLYVRGQTQFAPSANIGGATSLGVEAEAQEQRLAYLEAERERRLAEQRGLERERRAQLQPDREAERRAQRQAELERQRAEREREAQARAERQGQQQAEEMAIEEPASQQGVTVVWSKNPETDPRADQPDVVAVVPPVAESALRELEQALQARGYDVGGVNGQWDPQTYQALTRFQQDQGLQADGRLEPQTLATLNQTQQQIQRAAADQQQDSPRG